MSNWEIGIENSINVITTKTLILNASYILESDISDVYTNIPGSFSQFNNRYTINHTFNQAGNYIIKIEDINGDIPVFYEKISVINFNVDLQDGLDAYTNKDNWKGLNAQQEVKITDTNILINAISTTLSNVKTTVDTLPTLSNIESSTILSKKTDISIVENICNSLPIISEIRDEMINITFGGLEIANNQLTIKDKNGIIIAIFDLFDKNGNPTMLSIYRRDVVV